MKRKVAIKKIIGLGPEKDGHPTDANVGDIVEVTDEQLKTIGAERLQALSAEDAQKEMLTRSAGAERMEHQRQEQTRQDRGKEDQARLDAERGKKQ